MSEIWSQVRHYSHLEKLKIDIQNLLNQTSSLRLAVRTPSEAASSHVNVVYLYGTIAIHYTGIQYNIPIAIYFDQTYPYSPPRCYVTPTSNMRIKNNHKHVDSRGVVYLPFLSAWNTQNSTLIELVKVISSTFSEDPPVFSLTTSLPSQPTYFSSSSVSSSSAYPAFPSSTLFHASAYINKVDTLKKSIAECITKYWYSTIQSIIANVDKQITLQSKLRYQWASLESRLKDMKCFAEGVASDTNNVKHEKDVAEEFVRKEAENSFSANSAVVPSDSLSAQILELTAKAQAYEDLIEQYYDFFKTGILELSEFLKLIRGACAEKYIIQQLLKKVLQQKRQILPR